MNTLDLINEKWSYGSYKRKNYKKAMIYTFHQYKDFLLLYNMSSGKVTVQDKMAEQMLCDQLITAKDKAGYEKRILELFGEMTGYDDLYIEEIYGNIQKERRVFFGVEAIAKEQMLQMNRGCFFDIKDGIDQSRKKDGVLDSHESILMILTEPKLFSMMKNDILEWRGAGKQIYVLVNSEKGYDIPSKEQMKEWLIDIGSVSFAVIDESERPLDFSKIYGSDSMQNQIENGSMCIYFYGQEGFLQCRNLRISAVVHGIPTDYFEKAMTNQHGVERACIAYVPAGFDIVKYVPMIEKTRLSYWQLSRLWGSYGEEIYFYEPEELYVKYPQYFLNIYANGATCVEGEKDYPIQVTWPDEYEKLSKNMVMNQYDQLRDQAICDFLNSFDHYEYRSTYFNEALKEVEIPWSEKEQQSGILVQGIRVRKAEHSYVKICKGNETIRGLLKDEDSSRFPLGIFSNFLFFLTPRLAQFYNDLRADRPYEQVDFEKGHLDYMMYYEEEKRIETFPLFRKACIALMKNGQFLFFHHTLGGGKMKINGQEISWTEEDVNVNCNLARQKDNKVYLYTPAYAKDNPDDLKEYRILVGENRVNFVISQERILCIRKGSVVLSSLGVVVSMEEKEGQEFLQMLGVEELENGYYDCSKLEISVKLDKPKEVTKEQWDQVVWAYGGGLSLILNGIGLCDGNHMLKWLVEEGWMSPLSRQTQESEVHKLAKHPRTAIGISKNGDLILLVYSGRTWLSAGADYNEMCLIARELFPDIWSMMNVDGGGSSVLGISVGNSFMELSYPATSFDSCAGMVRPINTILCLK